MEVARQIQHALVAYGLTPGPIDGKIGKKTTAAIRQFQKMHGLLADGIAGPKTLAELLTPRLPGRSSSAQSELFRRFGQVGQHQTRIKLPYPMTLAWDLNVVVEEISLHRHVAEKAQQAFEEVARVYSDRDIVYHGFDLFGGSLNVRKIRGGDRYSTHAWGIAIDIDPVRNRLRWKEGKAHLSSPDCAEFLDIWEHAGWYSLGRKKGYDWMHLQAVNP